MAKDNIELKAQNQTLQTKMQENQEKYDEDLKVLHKAKEELQNQNKEQNQQLKRLLTEKDQHTKTIETPNSWILYHKIKKHCAMLVDLKNMK